MAGVPLANTIPIASAMIPEYFVLWGKLIYHRVYVLCTLWYKDFRIASINLMTNARRKLLVRKSKGFAPIDFY